MNDLPSKKQKGFPKGVSGNQNGRPKGAINETTKRYARFKSLAAEKYERAFEILWEAVEAKEPWAHQLFFKELVPKKVTQPTILIDNLGDTVEAQINAITRAFSHLDELTLDEALNLLRVLNSIKNKENVEQPTEVIIPTRESLIEQLRLVEKIIDYKTLEEKA